MAHKRSDYLLDSAAVSSGGHADVYFGVRKQDGLAIAFKLRRYSSLEARSRMKREIEVQRSLTGVNIMPILDWDDKDHEWYVMPRGEKTLADLSTPVSDKTLFRIVESILAALAVAHAADCPHRDVKPRNIIRLREEGRTRWVLADFGITRRPRGETTSQLTVTNRMIGTEGYASPEAYRDGHSVSGQGDLYSLGKVIAWAKTGEQPIPNVEAEAPEPWRRLARALTKVRPEQRPASAAAALTLLRESFASHDRASFQRELEQALAGGPEARLAACLKAVHFASDHDMMLDHLARLTGVAPALVTKHPDDTKTLVEGMIGAFASFGSRSFDYMNTPLHWIHTVLRECAHSNISLFEDLLAPSFDLEASLDRFAQRKRTVDWLDTLKGEPADAVADYLRSSPEFRKYVGGRLNGATSPAIVAAMQTDATD